MVVKTPQALLTLALKDCGATGVGQTPSAEDLNDAFDTLNMMLAQWNRKRWLVFHLVDAVIPSTGAASYTIGPGGDLNRAVRPDRIESGFFRQVLSNPPNQVDYPLEILQSREDYNRIALKKLPSFTRKVFYDSGWPLGTLYPYPVPQSSLYEIHLSLKETLAAFTGLTQTVNLPDEYFAALFYNSILRLGVRYPISRDQTMLDQWETVKALAKDSLNVLRGANAQIASLSMPADLVRGGAYNVYSDSYD
jgi:hypothetical protein